MQKQQTDCLSLPLPFLLAISATARPGSDGAWRSRPGCRVHRRACWRGTRCERARRRR